MRLIDMDKIRAWIRNECRAKGSRESGIALISVILLILVLSVVSAATIVTSITELKIGGNFKTSVQSFYNAEAGVQYALAQIRGKYAADTLTLTGSPVVVHYGAPNITTYPLLSNGQFPFSNWTTTRLYLKTGTTTDYTFPATGYYANSKTLLQVVLKMPSFYLVKGMFAGTSLYIKNNLTYSGSPEFGSNGSVDSKKAPLPDVVLGPGAIDKSGSTSVKHIPALNPDPLGAASLVSFHNYSSLNNNLTPPPSITSHIISAPLSLRPGNYYLSSFTGDLIITGTGPVNIYVAKTLSLNNITFTGSGPLTIYYHGANPVDLNGASINSGGSAGKLSIISDSSATFNFNNSAVFSGLFYAPNADLVFKNNGDVNGLLWANNIDIKNNMNFHYDAGAASFFGSASNPALVSWKQL